MTADLARLEALANLDPNDLAARDALRNARRRAGISAALIRMDEVEDASLPPGWEWYFAQVEGGDGGAAWYAAPDDETALAWAVIWGDDRWAKGAEVDVYPVRRTETGGIARVGWPGPAAADLSRRLRRA